MNPDQPSREEIEARITALLLGELPGDEARLLRWTISQDPELQKLHDRLKSTIGFMHEAVKPSVDAITPKDVPLKLSPERRQKLLAHFKTPRANKLFWLKRIEVPTLVPVLAVLAVVALLVAIAVPNFVKSRSSSQRSFGTLGLSRGGPEESLSGERDRAMVLNRRKPVGVTRLAAVPAPPPPVAAAPAAEAPAGGIVLPEAQPSSTEGGVYPQTVVGFTPVPNNFGAPVTTPSDSLSTGNAGLNDGFALGVGGKSRAAGENTATWGLSQGTFDHGVIVGGLASPSEPTKGFVEHGAEIVPVLGDTPLTGRLTPGTSFQQRLAKTENRAASSAGTPAAAEPDRDALAGSGNEASAGRTGGGSILIPSGGASGATAANRKATNTIALVSTGVTRDEANGLRPLGSPTPSAASGAPAVKSDTEITDMDEALSRYAKLTGRKVLRSGLPASAKISLPNKPSESKEEQIKDLESALAANNVAVINMDDKFVKALPVNEANSAGADNNQAEAIRGQPYWEAKRKLGNMIEFNKLLAAKIEATKLDLQIPKSSTVEITSPAVPGQSQNAWQKLTGEVESKARIRVEPDTIADVKGIAGSSAAAYDPYFLQTTLEEIQSDAVLGKVVDELKLDEAWAKNGGEKLKKEEAIRLLKQQLDLKPVPNTKLVEIGAQSDKPEEAAKIANAVAEAFRTYSLESRRQLTLNGVKVLEDQFNQEKEQIRLAQAEVDRLGKESHVEQADQPLPKPPANAPVPQPEIRTRDNAFSTFSVNVSDVSFKLAAASLEKGQMPDAASIRSEEFINAFDYRDPEAAAGQPLAFAAERARYPFAHNRELLRFSIKTAAAGRQAGRPLNLVLLLDTSGSMERADRVAIIREALHVLAAQLQPQDTVSVVTFARTARLWADGVPGDQAGETLKKVSGITPEGGTNLEEAMRLAYETARRHYLANGLNRVVMLTDGAANLGNVDPHALKQKVEANRKQGIALDCFGIGWEGYNDDLLEQFTSNGDGRYAFINSPEEAAGEFAAKLAGALQVAAQDVKVQVEFNPQRVVSWRQIGYAKHQLTKEQFRDNTVAAGEIAAQEAGNALYTIETKPDGVGPIVTVRVRYRLPGTQDYRERSWDVDYRGSAPALDQSSAAMRLAATASAFSEWLASSPFAEEVTPDQLLGYLSGVPEVYGADPRPKQLEWMIRQAKSVSGK
jgi:Mg-chelatase subunit ChlD/anti-sigma factor RsiW